MDLCSGTDVFAMVPTGGGKSTLTHGPVLADRAAGIKSIAVVLVPTKALADDQVRLMRYFYIEIKLTLIRHELQTVRGFFEL